MENPEHMEILKQGVEVWNKWRKEHSSTYVDFWEADLSGVDLSGADLSRIRMCKANLVQADLSCANLAYCDLHSVNLERANLRETDLTHAELYYSTCTQSDFTGARLTEAKLYGAKLVGTKFDQAEMTKVSLWRADLSKASLVGAKLMGALIMQYGPQSEGPSEANLSEADFREADLSNAYLPETNFHKASFQAAKLCGIVLRSANLSKANLENAILRKANLSNADLCGAYLGGTDVDGANFENANMSNADIRGARNIHRTNFGSILDATGLRYDADQIELPLPRAEPCVFLSYAWADKSVVMAVDQWLRNMGARVIVDERNFVAGHNIRELIIRWIQRSSVVVCFISRHSKDRPYPKLEREIANNLNLKDSTRVIYFKLDDTETDIQHEERLFIAGNHMSFKQACQELWHGITQTCKPPREVSLSRFEDAGNNWTQVPLDAVD